MSPQTMEMLGEVLQYAEIPEAQIADRVESGLGTREQLMGFKLLKGLLRVPSAPPKPVPPTVTEALVPLMARYIPQAAMLMMDTKPKGSQIAELRHIAVVFINVAGLSLCVGEHCSVASAVNDGQALMEEIERVIFSEWDGTINKLLVDDKGLLCLCAFGLEGSQHADDPARAVFAAVELAESLPTLAEGVTARIGVAFGRCFCGVVGSEMRHEYTMMGDKVNLSARLMTKADVNGVLVDHDTMKVCRALKDTTIT